MPVGIEPTTCCVSDSCATNRATAQDCGLDRIRTCAYLLMRQGLYQLSYKTMMIVALTGFEPAYDCS